MPYASSTELLFSVPRDVWEAGPAARAPLMGRWAPAAESATRGALALRRQTPGLLRAGARRVPWLLLAEAGLMGLEWYFDSQEDQTPTPLLVPFPVNTQRVAIDAQTEWLDTFTGQKFIENYSSDLPSSILEAVLSGPKYQVDSLSTIPPGFGSIYVDAREVGGTLTRWGISSRYGLGRYRFIRVVSFNVRYAPATAPAPLRPVEPQPFDPDAPIPYETPTEYEHPAIPGFIIPGLTEWYPPYREQDDTNEAPIVIRPTDPNVNVPPLILRPTPTGVEGRRPGPNRFGAGAASIALEILDIVLDLLDQGGDCPDPCPDPCPELDYDQIREIVYEELDSKFPPARPTEMQTITYSGRESLSVTLPSFSQRVRITQTSWPVNARTQDGGDSAPDVLFSGWISFGFGNGQGLRERIDYVESSYKVPEGATDMTITLYRGHRANIRVDYLVGGN